MPNDGVYEGAFKDGKAHGHGTFKWADGRVHEGAFKDGKAHGHGTKKWPDGAIKI